MAKMALQDVADLAATTGDSYSFDRYYNWTDCVLLLAIKGYTKREAEWVLRSKWMRWAGDQSGAEYGHVTASDLDAFLVPPHFTIEKVREKMTVGAA